MTEQEKLINWILRITVAVLGIVVLAVVFSMLHGLFVETIDNKEIFSIIGPAFNTIIGAFVGLLGGISISSKMSAAAPAPTVEPEANVEEEK